METFTLHISAIQLIMLKSVLDFEIKTEGQARLMKEPALKAYKRLVADPAGFTMKRGQAGRIEALEIVQELLDQLSE